MRHLRPLAFLFVTTACETTSRLGNLDPEIQEEATGSQEEDNVPEESLGGASNVFDLTPDDLKVSELLRESFDNEDLGARGWYDIVGGQISAESAAGSGSWECSFNAGASTCGELTVGRHAFEETEALLVEYQVRYSAGFSSSSDVFLLSNDDSELQGPGVAFLSLNVGRSQGQTKVGMTDSGRVDLTCIDPSGSEEPSPGCGGLSADEYAYPSAISVNGCNGGYDSPDEVRCSLEEQGDYYNERLWFGSDAITDDRWHHVELYVKLNSLSDDGATPNRDGVIEHWVDGARTLLLERLTLRSRGTTGLAWDQILVAPYSLDGEDGTVWIDELVVHAAR